MQQYEFFLKVHTNAAAFLDESESFLLMNESANNLILGIATGILRREIINADDEFFATLYQNGSICGQLVKSHKNRALILNDLPMESLEYLISELKNHPIHIHRIQGPKKVIKTFALCWERIVGGTFEFAMMHGIYELKTVVFPKVKGEMIVAETRHQAQLLKYVELFIRESFPNEPALVTGALPLLQSHLYHRRIYLWVQDRDCLEEVENGQFSILSMAATTRETHHSTTISLVFTPHSQRQKGYASALVAQLSQFCLDKGKRQCNLFTDLSNTTSNSIYQKIGYNKVADHLSMKLLNKVNAG